MYVDTAGWFDIGATSYADVPPKMRAEAGKQFGLTSITMPGRSDVVYPRLSYGAAAKVGQYWIDEADRIIRNKTSGVPKGAAYSALMRALGQLRQRTAEARTFKANGLVPDQAVVNFWKSVDDLALRLKGVKEQPTRWAIFKESVVETVEDLGRAGFKWGKWILYGVGAIIALNIVQTFRRK